MLAACDCYVSLHRSEGFGLTPAEAMYLGKPVIATGYSGNLDYMTPENSYLVDYELQRIGRGNSPYPADGEWADPDIDHAARLMREVVEDPLAAERRGQQAAADIRAGYSPDAAGETMERRLEHVRSHLEARASRCDTQGRRSRADGVEGAPGAHRAGPAPPGGRAGPAARAARRPATDAARYRAPAAGLGAARERDRGDPAAGRSRGGAGPGRASPARRTAADPRRSSSVWG